MSQARIVRYTRDGEPTADMHREKAKEYLDFFSLCVKTIRVRGSADSTCLG
jgi:hypothetical protein